MSVVTEYAKHRKNGIPAKIAWQWAKSVVAQKHDEPEGFNTNGHPFEVDGFEIEITIEPDDSPDYSFYGEFVDSWQTGAVENPEAWTSHGNRNHHYIAYFVPAYSEVDRYNDLHKAGMDKQSARLEAHRLVMADLECAKEYAPVVAVVKAFKNEVELGYDCMGGLDYDDPSDAIFDHDMIGNAIVHAKATLAKLIESAK